MKIFIDGEYGTTGLQIKQRLAKRKDIEVISIAEEKRHDEGARKQHLQEADFAILCLPDEAAKESVSLVGDANTRIIDASTAHRVDDEWVYGFIELEPNHSEKIKKANRVSNPGCYSTAAIAIIRPLVASNILPAEALISLNAISGYSGGGKKLIEEMEKKDAPPYFIYGLDMAHKHVPEIEKHGLLKKTPIFIPSVGNFKQGMAVQLPLHMEQLNKTSKEQIKEALKEYYINSQHIEIKEEEKRIIPTELVGTDKMQISINGTKEKLNLTAHLDNLGKGASGACLQSLELMIKNQA